MFSSMIKVGRSAIGITLRQNLNSRIQKKFFGVEATQKMKLLEADKREVVESELLNVYMSIEHMLLYISKRFDFSETNILSKLQPLTLERIITYDEAVSVAEELQFIYLFIMKSYIEYMSNKEKKTKKHKKTKKQAKTYIYIIQPTIYILWKIFIHQ